jgi:hypothetical protein
MAINVAKFSAAGASSERFLSQSWKEGMEWILRAEVDLRHWLTDDAGR